MAGAVRKIYAKLSDFLKNRRGSPLLEEGMLIALAVMTLAVVFSIVLGILGGIQKAVEDAGFTTDNFMSSLNDLWSKILAFLGFQT